MLEGSYECSRGLRWNAFIEKHDYGQSPEVTHASGGFGYIGPAFKTLADARKWIREKAESLGLTRVPPVNHSK